MILVDEGFVQESSPQFVIKSGKARNNILPGQMHGTPKSLSGTQWDYYTCSLQQGGLSGGLLS